MRIVSLAFESASWPQEQPDSVSNRILVLRARTGNDVTFPPMSGTIPYRDSFSSRGPATRIASGSVQRWLVGMAAGKSKSCRSYLEVKVDD